MADETRVGWPRPKRGRAPRPKGPRRAMLAEIADTIGRFALAHMAIDEAVELRQLDRAIAILDEVGRSLARADKARGKE